MKTGIVGHIRPKVSVTLAAFDQALFNVQAGSPLATEAERLGLPARILRLAIAVLLGFDELAALLAESRRNRPRRHPR